MPLLSSTPEIRRVPAANGQFRERRLIRGVGARERAIGNAYGKDHLYGGMDSKQRASYGSQRNYARAMEGLAGQRAAQQLEDENRRKTQEAYNDGLRTEPPADPVPEADPAATPAPAPATAAVNNAETVLGKARRRGFSTRNVA